MMISYWSVAIFLQSKINNKMNADMSQNEILDCVKVAICVCAIDGLISQTEEQILFQLISSKFPEFSRDIFNLVIDDFFESSNQIEDYLNKVHSLAMREFTLSLCKESASADGLDFRENLAIQKACLIWGLQS